MWSSTDPNKIKPYFNEPFAGDGSILFKIWCLCCEQEELQKKKAEYAEKMKNMVALIHKQSEEKRAMVQARKGEDILTIEEKAAKYRATGYNPKKFLGCLSF